MESKLHYRPTYDRTINYVRPATMPRKGQRQFCFSRDYLPRTQNARAGEWASAIRNMASSMGRGYNVRNNKSVSLHRR